MLSRCLLTQVEHVTLPTACLAMVHLVPVLVVTECVRHIDRVGQVGAQQAPHEVGTRVALCTANTRVHPESKNGHCMGNKIEYRVQVAMSFLC